jgi:hypothetical protein
MFLTHTRNLSTRRELCGARSLKLIVVSSALIALVNVCIVDKGGGLGGMGAITTIVVAGSLALLVAIDTARMMWSVGKRSALLGGDLLVDFRSS